MISLVQRGQRNAVVDLGWTCLFDVLSFMLHLSCAALRRSWSYLSMQPDHGQGFSRLSCLLPYPPKLFGQCGTTLLLLTSCPSFPFNKLGIQDLFWEARLRNADHMASLSKLGVADGGKNGDGENVSLLQDACAGALIRRHL